MCVCVCVCVCVWSVDIGVEEIQFIFSLRARSSALKRLASLLASNDGHFESLSLSNSKLKEHTVTILESLLKNNTLLKLDIRCASVWVEFLSPLCECLWGECY